jgi:hypothetical protein
MQPELSHNLIETFHGVGAGRRDQDSPPFVNVFFKLGRELF